MVYKNYILTGRTYTCTTILNSAYHLWCHIDTLYMVILIHIDCCRCFQCLQFDSLSNCSVDLARKCCHIRHSSSIYNADLLCTQTFCRTYRIHGHVTAANHCYFLTSQIRNDIFPDISQELYS